MSREIMQQVVVALKALMTGYVGEAEDAIDAIEKELAKPEQEFNYTEYGLHGDENGKLSIGEIPRKPWVGLTDEEIEEAWGNTPMMLNARSDATRKFFARAIESKLKEKNT